MDPLQPQVAPAPSSPAPVQGVPAAPGQGMSQEEMMTNLQALMSRIDSKYQDFNAHKFSSNNKVKEQQGQSLREVFDLLQSVGVDPSNVEEVKAFLDKIKESNPDLYQQIESSLEALMQEDTGTPLDQGGIPPTGDVPPANMNMNTNATPQENI